MGNTYLEKKKIMIFNYTTNHQFTTRVTIDNVNSEVVPEAKLLTTVLLPCLLMLQRVSRSIKATKFQKIFTPMKKLN